MSAAAVTIARRNIQTHLLPVCATSIAALLFAATLPKLDLAWLALPAAACLLWSWRRRTWQESAWLGLWAGMIYFSFAFRWFGETAGSVVGWLAPILVLGPAVLSAWTFALTAVAVWFAARNLHPQLAALAAAAAFTVCEGLRSYGTLANPFGMIAYPQVTTALGTLAAFGGASLVTFAVMYGGALVLEMVMRPRQWRLSAAGAAVLVALVLAANIFAPAARIPAGDMSVAIVQGNIRQQLKWVPGALETAVGRYEGLTSGIRSGGPHDHIALVVWPETVIPTDLSAEPALQLQFRQLALDLGTTLVVGSLERRKFIPYNTLWFIDAGGVERIYRKRKLVPFAETLPAEKYLNALPVSRYISRFGAGVEATVVPVGTHRVAPLICWESEFPDLIAAQIMHKADVLVLSTDDAWFGESDGPFQHAQIAQMRAIETGRWVVRAAATGISGIIAPNGAFTERSVIDTVAVITGKVGNAVDTPFNHIGQTTMLAIFAAVYAGLLGFGVYRRRRRD